MTTRLANIEARHSSARLRDTMFGAFVALAAMISIASIETADAATQVAQR